MSAREKNSKKNRLNNLLTAEVPGSSSPLSLDLILELRDVVKTYRTGVGGFSAINGISLEIFAGEFVGVIGKSGAGKTTLLNMISGVSEITSGDVLFTPPANGQKSSSAGQISVHALDENQMALWRGRNLGIVYQSFELMPQMDLVDNIILPQDFTGKYRPLASHKRAMELLEMVELTDHANKKPAQISGGQKQRIAIARALVNDPPIILADEPTGNLDSVTAERIFKIFEKLVAAGKTVIMVTHDLSLAPRFSRWVQIADGEIISQPGEPTPFALDIQDDASRISPVPISNRNGSSESLVINQAAAIALIPGSKISNGKINGINQVNGGANPAGIDGGVTGPLVNVAEKSAIHVRKITGNNDKPRANGEPAILLTDVVKTYVNAAGEFPALKGIDLRIDYGQFVSLIGKSGSGKSTLLNMLTGIDHPTSGEVIIGGKPIYKMSESKRALWRGKNVGIVFQFFQLLPTLTLLENTMLPMDYCNVFPVHERIDRAMMLLEKVGLENEVHKLPSSVSSGQQQSAAIARSLANDPPIIVADEPTGNLDSRAADVILRLFNDLANQGKTILIVTHDQSFTSRTERTVILSDGEFVDETLARALPFMDHPQMLALSRQIAYQNVVPGATVLRSGDPADSFFMIAEGQVDVLSQNELGVEVLIARLGPGQYFGGAEFEQNGRMIANVRATDNGPVRLAVLGKDWQIQDRISSSMIPPVLSVPAKRRLEENNERRRGS